MGNRNGINNARQRTNDYGQSTIEFTFAMMVTLVLVYALVMVLRWAGLDLAERRFAHEKLLTTTINPITNQEFRPEQQLNPNFYKPRKLETSFRYFNFK